MTLPRGKLGWAMGRERHDLLQRHGVDPVRMMMAARDALPNWNKAASPLDVYDILDQGNQGACQGHSLAACFSICYYLQTGRKEAFSRACGYYKSQEKDGIRGDEGSTLHAGQWVATQHGMCLESEWPYPSRYNPREPAGVAYRFKLVASKPLTKISEIIEWLSLGLPIQTGLMWGSSCDQEIVDDYRGGAGGHSTCFWQFDEAGNIRNLNSWGKRWNGDGCHSWSVRAVEQALRSRWSEFVGYAPAEMIYPVPEVIA